MAKKKNPHVGRSLDEFVKEQRAKDPEFAAEWDKRQLARRIRNLREAQNLTQAQLATRAHTTQSAIARLESSITEWIRASAPVAPGPHNVVASIVSTR